MVISLKRLRKWLLAAAVLAVGLSAFGYYYGMGLQHETVMSGYVPTASSTLILDAGHGGADGGAVSLSGVKESDINLAIALKAEALAALYGLPTVLTRSSPDIDYPEGAGTIREKKVADTKSRVALINSIENAVVVSIHQNIYASSSVEGPQVLFTAAAGSEELAQAMQGALISALAPAKERTPAQVPGNVYIMNHISCPAVLIECGFLSSPADEAKLLTEAYQVKIASAILSAYITRTEFQESAYF